eukprot:6491326-Amphidinium_carterae.4
MAGTLERNPTTIGLFKTQERRLYVTCYNTTLPTTVSTTLDYTSQLTRTTPLDFLGKTIELQDDGAVHLSSAQQDYDKILRASNMDKCNPTTTPCSKKPPIAAQPLDKEQHSQYRTAVEQAFAVKKLSRALQQPDNEYLKNLKQLHRHIKGTTHYKVILAPEAEHN